MKIDPYAGLKAWLRRYGELQADANRLFDRVAELRGRIESSRTSSLARIPHAQNHDSDRTSAVIAQLEEIEIEARAAQQAATATRRDIEAAIKKITGPRWADRREVLRLRYVDCLQWEDAAERLFGDNPAFWDKHEPFVRRIFKLHRSALEELSKFVPLEQRQKNANEKEDMKNEHF